MRLLLFGLSFLLLLVIVSWGLRQQSLQVQPEAVSSPTVTAPIPPVDSQITSTVENKEANITVDVPQENDMVSSPFTISGQARVFENSLNYRLSTLNGTLLKEGFTTAQSPDIGQFGPFTITVQFDTPKLENAGVLEVFSLSAKDGSEINKVRIPLRLVMIVR